MSRTRSKSLSLVARNEIPTSRMQATIIESFVRRQALFDGAPIVYMEGFCRVELLFGNDPPSGVGKSFVYELLAGEPF